MDYRNLGSSDLEVSHVGLGTMNFGTVNDEAECHRILDLFLERGGNLVDTANIYSRGKADGRFHERGSSEQIIGSWLKSRGVREKVIIATKVLCDMGDGMAGLSKKAIVFQVERSLERLGIERIDLYQAHGFDKTVPLEETLAAFHDLQKAGKIRHFGCSNFHEAQIRDASEISRCLGIPGFVSYQNAFNLVLKEKIRKIPDFTYVLTPDSARELGMGLIAYNSLANGFLAGKYRPDGTGEPSSRGSDEVIRKHCFNPTGWNLLALLETLASEHRTTVGSVLMSWYKMCPVVTVALVGPRTAGQLEALLHRTDLVLSAEDFNRIERASDFS